MRLHSHPIDHWFSQFEVDSTPGANVVVIGDPITWFNGFLVVKKGDDMFFQVVVFLDFFMFTPKIGEMIQFDFFAYFFQMGWSKPPPTVVFVLSTHHSSCSMIHENKAVESLFFSSVSTVLLLSL